MTIKIAYPSHISPGRLRRKTKQLCLLNCSNTKRCSRNYFIMGAAHVLIQKQNIILSFDSNDCNAIKQLRFYVLHLFCGQVIGVDRKNPITTCLNDIKEFLFLDG